MLPRGGSSGSGIVIAPVRMTNCTDSTWVFFRRYKGYGFIATAGNFFCHILDLIGNPSIHILGFCPEFAGSVFHLLRSVAQFRDSIHEVQDAAV